jgi:hypothetical protein
LNRPKLSAEFALGLVGSLLGIMMGIVAILLGGAAAEVEGITNSRFVAAAWAATFLSVIAVAATFITRNKPKLGGIFLIISAIGGFIAISTFFVMPAVLLGIAGFMALFKKDPS